MLKLYYDLLSQPSRALYIFLKKTKIPFKQCPIEIMNGAHKVEEFKAIHPFQMLPAIDDGEFKMFESVAILRYLCNSYPDHVSDHWYPHDLKVRARVDEYMEWQHSNTRFNCALYVNHKMLFPLITGKPAKQSSLDRYMAGIELTLTRFEEHWLLRNKFLAGKDVSIADILAVCELQQTAMAGYDCFAQHPHLSQWHELVKEQLDPELGQANVKLDTLTKSFGFTTV